MPPRHAAPPTKFFIFVGPSLTSNPDLPYRLKHKLPLTPYVRAAFWGGDETHYSDFPAYQPVAEAEATV
ncbi:hypothetical protein BX591_107173 [Paraburkholderia bryophila]|uniref:Uncharacterized protein n=1 Tax=Paraburkholderia bryophila TaxID=420952 RepID=A0A329CE55_9BURK|nr:hypothetical protein BX591_107173 [Paraburkholderia bryophila]